LSFFTSHCEPEGRGNLVPAGDCFIALLLAITGYLLSITKKVLMNGGAVVLGERA
jgi:hypothetical protein